MKIKQWLTQKIKQTKCCVEEHLRHPDHHQTVD